MTNEMTAEEAVKWLKEVQKEDVHGMYYYEQKRKQALDKAIKALEQRDVFDKIKAEIERKAHSGQWSDATMYGMLKAVAIIDKYKAESEDKE